VFIAINAQFFHDSVPPQFVASQSAPYSNPVDPTSGSNDTLAATDAQPVLDPGPARIWGFTHPALSAVELNTVTPIGVGTATVVSQSATNGITIKQRHCSDFRIYTGEVIEVCREVLDCDGNPIDFTGVQLRFKTWGRRRTTITNDLLATGTTTGFCVTIPAQGKQTLSSEWAVRNSAGQVVASGPFVVRGRP